MADAESPTNATTDWIARYIDAQVNVLRALDPGPIAAVIELLGRLRTEGRQLFVCGNGGSASNASHFANDLGKSASDALVAKELPAGSGAKDATTPNAPTPAGQMTAEASAGGDAQAHRFRVLSLNDNIAWLTAIANDYAYEDIFLRQLENYAQPGDALLAISVSGNSPNIVKATDWANRHGLCTLAITGKGRGALADLAQHPLILDDTHFGRVEDVSMTILHLLCYHWMENSIAL
ncbi:MAG: SIS domain-containing protein [Opitutales bacterium]